jgi:hypothetical protein
MMNQPDLICQNERRRRDLRRTDFNGLDYIEVGDDQRTLIVYFLQKAPEQIRRRNISIQGGRRVRDIQVIDLRLCRQVDPDRDDCMIVTVDKPGDFSTYRLCLVELDEQGRPTDQPLSGFDPRYACLEFSFKAGCPSDLDCKPQDVCPPEPLQEPEINYLAKDYASFRQLILDRLALIMPGWQERHVPDIGIALVEVLAYAADRLSYYQDAVATEAYLNTARQRISVHRHARLVDYPMHEGCNARAWLCVEVEDYLELDPDDTAFVTSLRDARPQTGVILAEHELQEVPGDRYEVFEPLVARRDEEASYQVTREHLRWVVEEVNRQPEPIKLYRAHNRIRFYTWGDQECCLPRGATTATLYDGVAVVRPGEPKSDYPQVAGGVYPPLQEQEKPEGVVYLRELDHLDEGDFLIFEEVKGPKTGNLADADPGHRHVVRLTRVERVVDELYQQPVLEITWAEADALPFPLCISTQRDAPDCDVLQDISVARGNVILVDHGRRVRDEDLGCVPVRETIAACECGRPSDVSHVPGRFRPRLERGPLVFSQPLPEAGPAGELFPQDPRLAVPWAWLAGFDDPDCTPGARPASPSQPEDEPVEEDDNGGPAAQEPAPAEAQATAPENPPIPATGWHARRDVLNSSPGDRHFVAEVDGDGRAQLRFGDGELGRAPQAGARFLASYRVGGGPGGNVGAETITHLVYRRIRPDGIQTIRNPLPAAGGTPPEPIDDVRLFAPHAFRRQLQRAITADDYAAIVMREFPHRVQRAAAALRWTGSWDEVLVAVDPRGAAQAEPELLEQIAACLHRYRRMGHDLVVASARQVALDIELDVCVLPDFLRGHVKAALLERFSNRALPDGRLGFFHPDNLTFGAGVYLSQLAAAAQAVPGVESVRVTRLERMYEGPNDEIAEGVLNLGALEVARLDNDPSFPEHGLLTLIMGGGR